MSNQIKILNSNDESVLQRLFGRTIDECVEALNLLEERRRKSMDGYAKAIADTKIKSKMTKYEAMTKSEAIDTVKMVMGYGQNTADQFVKCLAALGVLKFEEEPKFITIEHAGSIRLSDAIAVLQNLGYKVYKAT